MGPQRRENVNDQMRNSLASTKTTLIKPLDKKHEQTKVEWTIHSEKMNETDRPKWDSTIILGCGGQRGLLRR